MHAIAQIQLQPTLSCIILQLRFSSLNSVSSNCSEVFLLASDGATERIWPAMRMSSSMVVWGLLALLVLGASNAVQEAQAQCAGADLNKLYSCLSASTANAMPSAACCQALAGFNSANGEACLCAASTDPRFASSGAKAQYAILIPQKCNLKYKAGYVCNGVVIPGGQ